MSKLAEPGLAWLQESYAEGITGVFWDLNDFPIPERLDPNSFYMKIKSALEDKGYFGPLSIFLVADMKTPRELIKKYDGAAGISISFIPEGVKDGRDDIMLLEILLWALEIDLPYQPHANLVLLAKDFKDWFVLDMHSRGYNLFLTEQPTSKYDPPSVSSLWLFESLSDGHVDKKHKTIADSQP